MHIFYNLHSLILVPVKYEIIEPGIHEAEGVK